MVKVNKQQIALLSLGICSICLVPMLFYNAVDNSLSQIDKQYIAKYLVEVHSLPEKSTYEDEVNFIISVQHAVLNVAPGNEGIPFGQKREPKELYEAKTGLCFDRSRVIEKILRYSGFDARHVFMLSKEQAGPAIKAIMTVGVSSHAVTEVLTKNGWLIVDSNAHWVSTDADGSPISIEKIQSGVEHSVPIRWGLEPPSTIYAKPFTFVYGLYSRHGYFYPPYNIIPDVNYGELLQNIL
jgi:transglutaminase superfamily protein